MRGNSRVWGRGGVFLAAGCVLLASALAARGDVANGGFEADPPLDGWFPGTWNPPGDYVQAETDPQTLSTVAHLHAECEYVWQEGAWVGAFGQAWLYQFNIVLQAGQTHLRFDGRSGTSGLEVLDPTVSVTVIGGGGGGGCAVASPDWSAYLIPLGAPPGSIINILVEANANPPSGPGQEGQTVQQTVDLSVDNFRLVPAPPALAVLLVGAALLRRR